MLNPDGVIVGNHRCSLVGRDLNRQYKMVVKEMFPAIWHTKAMVRRCVRVWRLGAEVVALVLR